MARWISSRASETVPIFIVSLRERWERDGRRLAQSHRRDLRLRRVRRVLRLGLDHADGDCAIECHDRRWIDLQQGVVEKNNAVPVCLFGGAGAHVTRGNGCLQRVDEAAALIPFRFLLDDIDSRLHIYQNNRGNFPDGR